jgi:hypothetical protein
MSRNLISVAAIAILLSPLCAEQIWTRHAIDESLRGADGVRLADFDGDGLADIVTGWEESGIIRLYLNPGPNKAPSHWPAVSVGRSPSPEDAVPVDVDQDGNLDILSCHEGKTRKVLVHFNRADHPDELLTESNWETDEFSQLSGQAWMFAVPIALNGSRRGIVIGSKGSQASITLLLSPENASADLSLWKTIRLRDAGWIMSLRVWDIDADGDQDVVFSDRKGNLRGVGWLQQPGDPSMPWIEHSIGGGDQEVMFLDVVAEPDRRQAPTILVSTRNSIWIEYQHRDGQWIGLASPNPAAVPHGKAIARLSPRELVMTANTHSGGVDRLPGVWLRREQQPWHAIGGGQGGKYDRIEVIDLNGDRHPDVLTCEERQNLGVIWYENPGR